MANSVVNRLFMKNSEKWGHLGLETSEDLTAYLDTQLEMSIINHRRKVAGQAPLFKGEQA